VLKSRDELSLRRRVNGYRRLRANGPRCIAQSVPAFAHVGRLEDATVRTQPEPRRTNEPSEDDANLQFDPAEHFEGFEELLAESEAEYRASTYSYREFDIRKGSLPGSGTY
jgi:hypothetical protein